MQVVDSTRIGELTAEFDGQRLTLVSAAENRPLSLAISDVRDLVQFVSSFNPVEIQRRRSFRVPVYDPSALAVAVQREGCCLDAAAVNISLNGILLRFADPACRPDLFEKLTVNLLAGRLKASLTAEVRSIRDCYFGLHFPCSMKNGHLDPPEDLVAVVMQLQRQWLARRADR